jgi:hypothetical protein
LGRLAESTKARYQQTLRAFAIFLATVGVENLSDINRSLVEKFKVWRLGNGHSGTKTELITYFPAVRVELCVTYKRIVDQKKFIAAYKKLHK